MKDENKTKEQLINELVKMRQRVAELEASESEYKKAKEALIASETCYRRLFEAAKDGILIVNAETGLIIDANPFLIDLLGFSKEEFISKELWEIGVLKDIMANKANFEELRQKGHIRYENLPLRTADGRQVSVEFVSNVYEVDHRKVIQCNIRDSTKRKQAEEALRESEEKLRLMFESLALGVVVSDLNGKILQVNEAKVRMHGYDNKEELIGRSYLETMAEKDHARAIENRRQRLEHGYAKHAEYTYLRKDGSEFLAEAISAILRDASGNPIGFITITEDITERKRMQEQLILTDRLASIGELASGIAHELNNPLTSVIGFSELLSERKDIPADIKEDLEVINREAKRTAGVVRNLLTFARKHPQAKQLVDINNIIQTVLALRAYEQRINNIQVDTRFAPDLPEVMADGFQLQQVFLNIITNAEFFMIEAHGRGTLTITTERVGDIIRASLADDGPGIPKENLEHHLFNPFFTTKEVGKGTGLGLSICHGIITAHGGRIYAESELGKGATFIIELPISQ